MAAATGAYHVIGEEAQLEPAVGRPLATGADVPGYQSAPDHFDLRSAAGTAKEAIVGALGKAPNVDLYTEPLDPGSLLSLQDRFTLMLESCRPWPVFADITKFNLPPVSEIKLRFTHNIETFFYNYIILALASSVFFVFSRFLGVISLVATLGLALYLHVLHPEPFVIVDGFSLDTRGKHLAVALCALISVFVFGAFGVLWGMALCSTVTVGAHGLLRDHTA